MTYHPTEVLNEKLERPWSLQRGAVVEGLILGCGDGPLPPRFSGSAFVQIRLTDTLGRESTASLPVVVNQPARAKKKTKTTSKTVTEPARPGLRVRGTLYDEPSISEGGKSWRP